MKFPFYTLRFIDEGFYLSYLSQLIGYHIGHKFEELDKNLGNLKMFHLNLIVFRIIPLQGENSDGF